MKIKNLFYIVSSKFQQSIRLSIQRILCTASVARSKCAYRQLHLKYIITKKYKSEIQICYITERLLAYSKNCYLGSTLFTLPPKAESVEREKEMERKQRGQEEDKEIKIYRRFPKYSDTQKICCNHSKIWTMWLYHRVMSPNDADRIANSADPDQTAPPVGAVWSGSTLFAQAFLSENLGSLR